MGWKAGRLGGTPQQLWHPEGPDLGPTSWMFIHMAPPTPAEPGGPPVCFPATGRVRRLGEEGSQTPGATSSQRFMNRWGLLRADCTGRHAGGLSDHRLTTTLRTGPRGPGVRGGRPRRAEKQVPEASPWVP